MSMLAEFNMGGVIDLVNSMEYTYDMLDDGLIHLLFLYRSG